MTAKINYIKHQTEQKLWREEESRQSGWRRVSYLLESWVVFIVDFFLAKLGAQEGMVDVTFLAARRTFIVDFVANHQHELLGQGVQCVVSADVDENNYAGRLIFRRELELEGEEGSRRQALAAWPTGLLCRAKAAG